MDTSHATLVFRDIGGGQMTVKRQLCEWTENGDGYWETSCNRAFDFVDGSPVGNHFNFCPYCGKTLIEKPDEQA